MQTTFSLGAFIKTSHFQLYNITGAWGCDNSWGKPQTDKKSLKEKAGEWEVTESFKSSHIFLGI